MNDIPKKNQEVLIKIMDMSKDGEGIGHTNGYTLFVKDTVIGDFVKVGVTKTKKNYGFARLIEIIEPSPERVEAPCPISRKCGGCQIMSMSYESQLEFKEHLVENSLKRIGGFEDLPVEPIIGMDEPLRYRNKAQYPVGEKDGKLIAGFYARHSHDIMPVKDCFLGSALSSEILGNVLRICEKYGVTAYDEETGSGVLRHILLRESFSTGEAVVCLVVNAAHILHEESIARELMEMPEIAGVCLNENRNRNNVILGETLRCIRGVPYIHDSIGNVRYRISPLSFYQVNPVQTKKLYDKVKEFADLKGDEVVWDLYCGIGTISMYLAEGARQIIGVDVVPEAIEDAEENAKLNNIENAQYITGKAEEVIPEIVRYNMQNTGDGTDPDESNIISNSNIVLLDPPRKGCEKELLDAVVSFEPEKIIYVSCDPATLARDLRIICDKGYEIKKVQPVDMFPMTIHVETVCLLSKLSGAKNHISVKVEMDEMDLTAAESKATYQEIQDWVQEKYGFHVTHLNIAKTKRKCGIIERQNFNLPKSDDSRSPETQKDKEEAIIEAFRHFQMI